MWWQFCSHLSRVCLLITIVLGSLVLSVSTGWSCWHDFGTPPMKGLYSLVQGTLAVFSLVAALTVPDTAAAWRLEGRRH